MEIEYRDKINDRKTIIPGLFFVDKANKKEGSIDIKANIFQKKVKKRSKIINIFAKVVDRSKLSLYNDYSKWELVKNIKK